jgi:hypothetical protein
LGDIEFVHLPTLDKGIVSGIHRGINGILIGQKWDNSAVLLDEYSIPSSIKHPPEILV